MQEISGKLKLQEEEYNMLFEHFSITEDRYEEGKIKGVSRKKIIVQGLGNVGYRAALFLSTEDDALITSIIEKDGMLVNAKEIINITRKSMSI